MASLIDTQRPRRPHAVCVPYPAQGHINPMFQLAKLLHHKGFHITFVNTEFNQRRLLKSQGPDSLNAVPTFRFETIPDGLPPSDSDATQDIPSLCDSTRRTCSAPFQELLTRLNNSALSNVNPPVTCIVSDWSMGFTLKASKQLNIPNVLFFTASACGFMGYVHYRHLVEKCIFPLKDDIMVNFVITEIENTHNASALIFNTFDDLEPEVLKELSSIYPNIFTIGPLNQLVLNNEVSAHDSALSLIGSNLWREQPGCLEWLDSKEQNSVVYVNFGSITALTENQLVEFAWGLANSKRPFLWVIRPDIVNEATAVITQEFVEETKDRGMLASWCPQEQILSHPAVGGFLTHCGWNSTVESLCSGVAMLCWPFFAEQQTNCWFCQTKWGVGIEVNPRGDRVEIEKRVRELMEGESGKLMKEKALEWKLLAEKAAAGPNGSSYVNLDNLINDVLLTYPLSSYDNDREKMHN
ncbi:UDP-glycosyltransferase 85A2 [Citrus sinensis]|nr:UDP-glycosyltransferase 85A2 [Citrus sinensis]